MAKRRRRSRRTTQEKRSTNWLLVAGIAVIGVVAVFGLLYLALRQPEVPTLAEYCAENTDRCVTVGAADAPVTLVEVSDFGCPHCRDFHNQTAPQIRSQYVDTGQVQWVFLPYALGPNTVPAANAALCAAEQGQYYEFAEATFSLPTIEEGLTREGFSTVAQDIGLDLDTFGQCVEEGRYNNTVSANQQIARQNRVSATPTFFVNDQMLRGAQPFAAFQQQFARYLES